MFYAVNVDGWCFTALSMHACEAMFTFHTD